MIFRLKKVTQQYPRQFWLVAVTMMLAYTFHSMLWPYILIYSSETLAQPLTAVAGLLTINAVVGAFTTFLGGAIADRFGRKYVMVAALILCAISWVGFIWAKDLAGFIVLMALNGATTPLYRLAADSMSADLIPADKRMDAYSILRMGNNIGVALGPAIGGFTAAVSYALSFKITGIGLFLCGFLMLVMGVETYPISKHGFVPNQQRNGYKYMLHDRSFLGLMGAYVFNRISSATIWMMLGVYAKNYFGINESLYGFIPTTNALMVIFFQVLTTRWVKKRDPGWMLVLGSAFYGLALTGVAFGKGFWAFWLCMVIATIGEMIAVPTSTTVTAALAPDDMRGRYMSIYNLTAWAGTGIGPLAGGFLSDSLGPAAMWYGGGAAGFIGAGAFCVNLLVQKRRQRKIEVETVKNSD